jgi:hypothetical protein
MTDDDRRMLAEGDGERLETIGRAPPATLSSLP